MFRSTKFALIAGAFAAMLGATSLAAQDQRPEQPRAETPSMMQDGGMMPMMGMMQQMSEMMEACNKMMQAYAGEHVPDNLPAQPQE